MLYRDQNMPERTRDKAWPLQSREVKLRLPYKIKMSIELQTQQMSILEKNLEIRIGRITELCLGFSIVCSFCFGLAPVLEKSPPLLKLYNICIYNINVLYSHGSRMPVAKLIKKKKKSLTRANSGELSIKHKTFHISQICEIPKKTQKSPKKHHQ